MGNVTSNYIKTINDIVSTSITQSLQSSTNNYVQDQGITITCDEKVLEDIAKEELKCWGTSLPRLKSGQLKASDISRLCKPILCIGNSNIYIAGAIFAETITKITEQTKNDISNTVENNITSFAQQENSGFVPEIGDTTENNVKNISKHVINVLTTTVQDSMNDVEVIQKISVGNMDVTNVLQSSLQKIIMQKLLENSEYVSAINQTATDLKSQTSSIRKNDIKNAFITTVKVVVIIVVLCIIAMIVKKYKKRR